MKKLDLMSPMITTVILNGILWHLSTAFAVPFQSLCKNEKRFGPSGIISSPNYPAFLTNHTSCSWFISGQPGEVITISFDDLDLEDELKPCDKPHCCGSAWVKISPAPEGGERVYCGRNIPAPFISISNQVWIKFHTSLFETSGRGFKLTYTVGPLGLHNCTENYFHCSNGKCIVEKWICNKRTECEDGSDEMKCGGDLGGCPEDYLKCKTVNMCYRKIKRCDDVIDCPDRSDEKNCLSCEANEMRCGPHSPDCFDPLTERCNRVADCMNGYDEKGCEESCVNKVMCASVSGCYSLDQECDGVFHCMDHSDEYNCGNCPRDQLKCKKGGICYSRSRRCDGVQDCSDYSDELNCYPCIGNTTRCSTQSVDCYNPLSQRCNSVQDCANGKDELGCLSSCHNKIMCASGVGCYSPEEECNGIVQCPDQSDELNCGPEKCKSQRGGYLCTDGKCIRESSRCDGKSDCADSSDECGCLKNSIITAAVMGSLICGLLIVVAISCTCRLYALRLAEQHECTGSTETQLSRLEQDYSYREPPPPYAVAVGGEHRYGVFPDSVIYGGIPRSSRRPRRLRRHRRRPPSPPPLNGLPGPSSSPECSNINAGGILQTLATAQEITECHLLNSVEQNRTPYVRSGNGSMHQEDTLPQEQPAEGNAARKLSQDSDSGALVAAKENNCIEMLPPDRRSNGSGSKENLECVAVAEEVVGEHCDDRRPLITD